MGRELPTDADVVVLGGGVIGLATAYHLLRTLAHEGYATRLPDGMWVLGERVRDLHGRTENQRLLARVRPALAALRDELGAAA